MRAVFASRRQLQRVFAEIGGTTVREVITTTRLERVAELLRAGDMPIKDVGAAVGLAQAAQLAKAFRRRYGLSPSQYQAARLSCPARPRAIEREAAEAPLVRARDWQRYVSRICGNELHRLVSMHEISRGTSGISR